MGEFEQIYQPHFGLVYRYALRLTGDPDAAEELTSHTFFQALQHLDQYRGTGSLSTWLCAIAKNAFFSARKAKPCPEAEPPPVPGPEDFLADRETAMAIHGILHRLPEPYKEVFTLRVLGELSFRQIGNLFDKSENWACVTYHRAKQKIQREMEAST